MALGSSRGWWRTAALALVAYAVFLVATAPASVLAWVLATATKGTVVLERPYGGLWRGDAAALVIVDRSGSAHRYEQLRWDWLGARLLAGEIALRLQLEDPKLHGSGSVALRADGVRVSDADFRLRASSLAAYRPLLSPAGLSGEFSLQTEGFTRTKDRLAGTALIAWRNAGTTGSGVNPLGDYRALVTGAGERAEFRVETVSGALRVDGHGVWTNQEGLSFQGTARSEPINQADLTDLLKLLGQDRGGGIHEIKLSGLR
jgi:hypothetical protein